MRKKIQVLFLDVDGTMTDGKIYLGTQGEVFKAFNIKDGCGIHDIAMINGIEPVVVTNRESEIVIKRCEELGISQVFQGTKNKLEKVKEYLQKNNIDSSCAAYIGDDMNDLSSLQFIKNSGGVTGCPLDAAREVRHLVNFVSTQKGGDGAVRDFIEFLLKDN